MIAFLSRIFIKNRDNYSDGNVRKKYGMLTGIVGIFLNVILFAGKFIAGTISGAISITADAFNNLSDAGSSFISLIGFQMADKKPDPDHPFGHGRMEYVTGMLVSVLIILMGFELGKTSFGKILHPSDIDGSMIAIIVLVVSIAVKVYMHFYNRIYGKKINSASMKATAMDSLSDSIATTVVLISIIVAKCTGLNIDGFAGLAVSAFILFAGIKSMTETITPLLGQAPDPEFVADIHDIVLSHPEIVGIHDLVVHDYGPGRVMISLHGEVSEDGNINELHDVIDICEKELHDKLGCSAIIHMDPVSVNNERVDGLKSQILAKIKEYNDKITIHDFRVVDGPTHTNIIFDAVIPIQCEDTPEQVKKKMEEIVESLPGKCFGVVSIDREYTEWQG